MSDGFARWSCAARLGLTLCALGVTQLAHAVSVSLNSPATSVIAAPATITVSATATPGAGRRILRVDFFRGTTRISSDTSAPYGVVLNNVPAGTYIFTALAIDSGGSIAISDPVLIRVDSAPTVALTAPATDAVFVPGAAIAVAASASDSDEAVRKVEFFAGDTLIGTQFRAPYQITWNGAAPGRYTLTARATDLVGLVTTSAPVAITVGSAPSVAIATPAAGAVIKGGTITVTATASDSDGTVAKVEFFDGGNLVATATASGGNATYSATINNLAVGSHVLTARATDDQGFVTTSSPVPVTVTTAVAQMYFIHTDHLNTPRHITDQARVAVWHNENTEAFGDSVPEDDPDKDGLAFDFPLRFPGQYFDRETRTGYNVNRDYDSAIGRYAQGDPTGLAGGINPFLYASGNPLSNIDSEGLWSVSITAFVPFLGPVGPGGSVVAGQNPNGSGFITGRIGVGIGGGLKIDPLGTSPGYDPNDCSWGASAGFYGAGDFNAGPFYASISSQRGYVLSGTRNLSTYHQPSAAAGARGRFSGINISGSVGSQLTLFGGGNCECGKQ